MKNLKNNAIIFFDGKCNLCNASVNFVIKNDSKSCYKFTPLTSDFTKDFFKDKKVNFQNSNTIILFDKNQFYTKSDAILRILKNLNTSLKYFWYFKYIPKKLRDLAYDLIACNRYSWFGKRTTCMIPSKENLNKFL